MGHVERFKVSVYVQSEVDDETEDVHGLKIAGLILKTLHVPVKAQSRLPWRFT